jgi:hypothetical protein
MRSVIRALSAALVVGSSIGAGWAGPSAGGPGETFAQFAAEYLEAYAAAHPVRATKLGIHDHDSRLPDLSRAAIRRRVRELDRWLDRLARIDAGRLGGDARLDYRVLDHAIRAELLELEQVRGWQRNPMLYNRLMADGTAGLVERRFAPLERRLGDLISRLEQYPAMIRAARKNLEGVPAAWADLAIKRTRGHLGFLREDVPVALRAQGLDRLDLALQARWSLARRDALHELKRFLVWLERDLEPRAGGSFRLGRELFERKLLYEEHIAMNVDQLVAMNDRAIRDYRQWVAREAARVDPERSVEEVMRDVIRRHPPPDELIREARRCVEQAHAFVRERQLVTLPTDELPIVRPTPGYARSGFASMGTPGPFETGWTEAYFNVTNVDPAWSEELQQQHLTYFNRAGLLGIAIHEVMPGHFVQLLYQRELATDVRKMFVPASLVEGWAHYSEQMMIDEGLGDGDPEIRLGQLRRALQRHARWDAAVALHTSDVTLEAAARRFADTAFFPPFPAMRETLRGTYDPTYLVYALGRMQIVELREDYERYRTSRGERFSLREFHDRLLRLGLPISLAREVLMPDAEPGENANGN